MKYDITEKMNFEDNPTITIKDTEIEVNATAETVLKLIDLSDKAEDNFDMMTKAYPLIFSKKDQKKINDLKLNAHDFGVLLQTAMSLAIGSDPDEEVGNE